MTLFNRPEIQNIVVTPVLYTPEEGTFQLTVDATGKVRHHLHQDHRTGKDRSLP